MRSYAEATKQAVREQCTLAGSNYAVVFTAPDGFTPVGAPTIADPALCPDPSSPDELTLTVTDGEGHATTMQIVVRTP
jgi:hypothetical protein